MKVQTVFGQFASRCLANPVRKLAAEYRLALPDPAELGAELALARRLLEGRREQKPPAGTISAGGLIRRLREGANRAMAMKSCL